MSKGTRAQAIIVGRMGADMQVRTTQAGKKFGNLRLACTDGYGDNEVTSWFDVAIFDEKKIEVLEKYTGKGSRLMVVGTLRVRKWEKDGVERFTTEIVVGFDGAIELLDSKDGAGAGGGNRSGGNDSSQRSNRSETRAQAKSAFDDLDDDVPF